MLQPRLGPKPFTPPKLSLDNTSSASELDRVFSVPAVPSSPALNGASSHSPPAVDPTLSPFDLDKTPEVSSNYFNKYKRYSVKTIKASYIFFYGSIFLSFLASFLNNLMFLFDALRILICWVS